MKRDICTYIILYYSIKHLYLKQNQKSDSVYYDHAFYTSYDYIYLENKKFYSFRYFFLLNYLKITTEHHFRIDEKEQKIRLSGETEAKFRLTYKVRLIPSTCIFP